MAEKRDVCGFLQTVRRFLLGRNLKNSNLRYAIDQAPRTPECVPNLPRGVNFKLNSKVSLSTISWLDYGYLKSCNEHILLFMCRNEVLAGSFN